MRGTIRATVKVAGFQRERRFVKGTPARVIKAWKIAMRARLSKQHPQPEHHGQLGTLAKDAERYYPLIRHLADWVSRRSEIRAWLPHLGDRYRHLIRKDDVLRTRGIWIADGRAAKTINNRVTALRNLYHVLDGTDTATPCDTVTQLTPQKTPLVVIPATVINAVMVELERRAAAGHKHAAADRARLMVLASTGKRPCEIERAQPADVDLRRRVWIARDAKGGFCPGAYLNDEMVKAWEAFTLAGAWGPFHGHFPRRLRDAGWPKGLRPYNLRHSTWIEASERGNDLADIQLGAGHKLMATTRRHYVPVLSSRMQRMSESLDGRFGW
jgi:integrase